jgi:hypothetical protein
MKRPLTSFLIRTYLNHEFKRLGKMTHLTIDSTRKNLSLTADLAGEKEPIEVRLDYHIDQEDGRLYFTPQNVQCSREWLTILAAQVLESQPTRVEVPQGLASTVVKLLKL